MREYQKFKVFFNLQPQNQIWLPWIYNLGNAAVDKKKSTLHF